MISYIKLENFRSFSKIMFDLRGQHKKPKRYAFVYGENGAGKSNLLSSIRFFQESLDTLLRQTMLDGMQKQTSDALENMKEIDMEDKDIQNHILQMVFRKQFSAMPDIITKYRKIASSEPMALEIGFCIEGNHGNYRLECSEEGVHFERLRYRLTERVGDMFVIQKGKFSLSPKIFKDRGYRNDIVHAIEQYWGKHTFLAILRSEFHKKNEGYVERCVHKNLLDILHWIRHVAIWQKEGLCETARFNTPLEFMGRLSGGTSTEEDRSEVELWEYVLTDLFSQLYPDIKKAYYVFDKTKNGFSYQLYFKKMIGGKLLDIPLSRESTGTQRLLEILPLLLLYILGDVVLIDEIDSGIHDLLMTNLIENMLNDTQGQLIVTTHNTLLLDELPPQNIYILRMDAEGNKQLDCVSDYAQRTQQSNSIRHKYLHGDYAGVPSVGFFDFDDIREKIQEVCESSSKDGRFA